MKRFFNYNNATIRLTFLLFVFIGTLNAQELFTITGKVTDDDNPFPGAQIVVKGTQKGTVSDFDGMFTLTLEKGVYTLLVGAASQPKEVNVNLTKNKSIVINMADSFVKLDEVLVSAVRVNSEAPVTHSNLSKSKIAKRNLGQDIPILMNYLPSVVTTSDAGAGIGYTGIRVRGSDATRVNITINGIPYNDSESMGTYWVDLPDFSSSTESLQLQRGVGTSTNGAGAFGASLNLLTDAISDNASAEISSSVGSFNTFKNTLKFSTGKLNDHFEIAGRFSKITSDGYIDRASSDLKSYFLQASYVDDNTLIKAVVFGGFEETYQAWYGVDAETLKTDRTFNFYTYDNEVDHYNQDHYQLHWNQKINKNWSSNIALHYTYGRGYFEQFKEDEDFEIYGFEPIVIGSETIDSTDIIRRRWLDNNFYGTTFSLNHKKEGFEFTFGGAWNKYDGDHFGEVIWAEYASNSQIRDHYYDSNGKKTDFNIFTKASYKINNKFRLYGDLQLRLVDYKTTGITSDLVPFNIDDHFNFFNPKGGITYTLNKNNNLYASYARANREPSRNNYENGADKPERLNDFELGWRKVHEKIVLNSNVYYMKYKDQLVLTGALDDVGSPIAKNIGNSYRLGLEIDANFFISDKFTIQPNIALSSSKNEDYYFKKDGELTNFGKTNIAFSPDVVIGNILSYSPKENLQFSLLSKYIGKQYMGNIDSKASVLESYFVNDFNAQYKIETSKIFKSITFTALVNNIFNEIYESNGYFYTYDDTWSNPGITKTIEGAGYYPQAGTNFLIGVNLKF